MMRDFHLLNTYWAIILPPLASVFGTFLLRQFFLSFPRELEEAAIVDGCGKFSVLLAHHPAQLRAPRSSRCRRHHLLEHLERRVLAADRPLRPADVYPAHGPRLAQPGVLRHARPGVGMAAGVLGSIPILIFYFIFQRRIVEGIAMTGLKGIATLAYHEGRLSPR